MENESTGMKGDESKLVHTGLKCSVGMLQQLTFPYVCKNHKGFYRESIRAIKPSKLASFPGLTCFYLPFVFTIIHGSGRPAKNGEGLRAFLNDIRWTPGGCGGEGGGGNCQCNVLDHLFECSTTVLDSRPQRDRNYSF